MADTHKVKKILDAVVAALEGAAFATVLRNRKAPVPDTQLPAVVVVMGRDSNQSETFAKAAWQLEVNVALLVKSADTEDLDAATLALRLAATQALLGDPSLGGLVVNTRLTEQSPPDFEDGGAFPVGATVLSFQVDYRTAPHNPI